MEMENFQEFGCCSTSAISITARRPDFFGTKCISISMTISTNICTTIDQHILPVYHDYKNSTKWRKQTKDQELTMKVIDHRKVSQFTTMIKYKNHQKKEHRAYTCTLTVLRSNTLENPQHRARLTYLCETNLPALPLYHTPSNFQI